MPTPDLTVLPILGAADDPIGVVMPRNHFIVLGRMDTRPDAEASLRGALYYVEGGAGAADLINICRKATDDSYEWVGIADTVQISVDMGGAAAFPEGQSYTWVFQAGNVDLTDFREARLSVRVTDVGAGTETLTLGYFITGGAETAFGSDVAVGSLGIVRSEWVSIPEAARTLVQLLVGQGNGDAVTEATTGAVVIEVRR